MLGYLDSVTDAQGNAATGAQVTITNADDGSPATLYAPIRDIVGNVIGYESDPLSSNVVSTDGDGQISVGCEGRFNVSVGFSGRVRMRNGIVVHDPREGVLDWFYYMTRAEVLDSRDPNGPSIDLTDLWDEVSLELWTRFRKANSGKQFLAARGWRMGFPGGSFLFRNFWLYPGQFVSGEAFTDTILVQSAVATTDFVNARARSGWTDRARSPWAGIENFTLQGTGAVGPIDPDTDEPTTLDGLTAESPQSDPDFDNGLQYNGYIARQVRSYNFSGRGLTSHRDRTWLFDSRASYNGEEGIAFVGNIADIKLTRCGSGQNDGDSLYVKVAPTIQIDGGDYWISNNAANGKVTARFIQVYGGHFQGADIRDVIVFQGTTDHSDPYYGSDYNFSFRDLDFRFQDPGNNGSGQPSIRNAFIQVNDARGVTSAGCKFAPDTDQTGTALSRPLFYYYLQGAQTVFVARDQLPDIGAKNWAAGDITLPNSLGSLTNDFTKLIYQCSLPDITTGRHRWISSPTAFVPGTAGGDFGRTDGSAEANGTIGEEVFVEVILANAVALPDNTVVVLGFVDLVGNFQLTAQLQCVSVGVALNTVTTIEASIDTVNNVINPNKASSYKGRTVAMLTANGPFTDLDIPKTRRPIAGPATTRYYLLARSTASGGGQVKVYGRLSAVRAS